jgi:AI-2 transport protein TqsA
MPMNEPSKIVTSSLVVLALVALAVVFIYTKVILVPFVISVFIYSAMLPLLSFIQKRFKSSRAFAVIISMLLFIVFAAGLTVLIYSSAKGFLEETGKYRERVDNFIEDASIYASKVGIDLKSQDINSSLKKLPMFSVAKNISGTLFSIISNTLLVVVFILFMITGSRRPGSSNPLIAEIQSKISKYINVKLMTSIATAILVGVVLLLFGVDLAFMFAVLTFLLNLIPNIGSIVATLLPIPVILLQFGLGWQLIAVLALTGSIQFTVGNIIEPKFMGDVMGLHPVTVLMFLMFWGLVWGVPGMFLAVPITAAMKIIFYHIEATKPLAKMLEGNFSSS